MDHPTSSKSSKFIAIGTGFLFACLLCGGPLFYLAWTGRFRQMSQPFAYAAQTSVAVPLSSGTSMPLSDIRATPSVDIASLSYSERFDLAGPAISDAMQYSSQGSYAEAALSWGRVIEIIPEWADGYRNRGDAYFKLLGNQRSQDEYAHYLSLAGADFDKAIELDPYSNGDYYIGRFKYYDGLAGLQSARADKLHFEKIALDNLTVGNKLGNFDPLAERYVIFSNITLGNCDEAIEQATRLIEVATEPSAALPTGLALGYFCKNDLNKALEYMDKAIEIHDTCQRRLERARILYAMDRKEDALTELDATISGDPYYCGERYYLRGLLHVEMGDLENAQDDLDFGMGQTWGRGGLMSYAYGKMALTEGDTEKAIQYFQDAEMTYPNIDPVLTKIRNDLVALGAAPLEVTPSFPVATAILMPTPAITARPTSSPDPSLPTPAFTPDPHLGHALIIDLESALEPVQIVWGFDKYWHFQPAQSLDHSQVQRLSVWLISSDTSQRLPRQISLWNFRNNMWGGNNELYWGENQINYPNEYVSPDGDVFIHFASDNPTLETTIDKFGITLTLQRTDGSIEVHGIVP
ncbi:MAG TPA: hypothetical protein VHP14_05685 [Anaerolineales bacterium]|nr:hypothetical protein [Anaerolineales bacterium]